MDTALLLDAKQVAELLGVAPSTITRWRASGAVPDPVHVGPHSTWWSNNNRPPRGRAYRERTEAMLADAEMIEDGGT